MGDAPRYENVDAGIADAPLYENVANELDVELLSEHRRHDADVRADVVLSLRSDPVVPDTIDADVVDGVVTLTGMADHKFQRKQAEYVARTIMGVADVYDEIELVGPTPSVRDVEQSIGRALGTGAAIGTDGVVVTASPGTVTLTGTVRSWAQRHAAVAAASDVAGVRTVNDRLSISD
jgi:osmotically-inducible protein OsmY